ncbi:MAG: hypothetical protein ACPHRO_11675, partial [Nannocystaceae bacterium]
MKRLSLLTFFCSGLVMGTATESFAQPEVAKEQEGDDILEVLMLPVEMQEANAAGMTDKEVQEVVATFRESGMAPGEAAAVLRVERALSRRRGVKKGFADHVLQALSQGKGTNELIASLREREASDPLDKAQRKELHKSVSARAKAERARTKARRKRDKEKRARGEKVIVRGQMRMMAGGDMKGDLRPPEAAIDIAWLQKRLEKIQRRMIKLDGLAAKQPEEAKAKGLETQRERLLAERKMLVGFIGRLKALDAEGQLEGSARDQLIDEIKTALKIERRKKGPPGGAVGERPAGAADSPRQPGGANARDVAMPGDGATTPQPGDKEEFRGPPPHGSQQGAKGTMKGGAGNGGGSPAGRGEHQG